MILSEAAANLKYTVIGMRKRRDVNRIARKYRKQYAAFFLKQGRMFAAEFEKSKYLFSESLSKLTEAPVNYTLADFDMSWPEFESETMQELRSITLSIESEAMVGGAEIANAMFDPAVGGSFDLANPRAVAWFDQFGGSTQYISGIQDTTRGQIKNIITQSIDEGWSYTQTSQTINAKFKDISVERAQLIATNEAAQAYEAGNKIFVDEIAKNGVRIEKKWMNSGDGRVSQGCQANTDDGWIGLNDPHTSGHQLPPRFPSCRCWEIYRESRD